MNRCEGAGVAFKTVLLCLGGFFLMEMAGSVCAQAQIFIEKGKVEVAVRPGQTVSRTLRVHNTSDQPLSLNVYWQDFAYQPPYDGTKKFFPAGVTERSMEQWVSFSPDTLTLPAFGQRDIDYTIHVPADASGGYYGVLFVEKKPEALKSSRGLLITARVGCLFFVETEDRVKQGDIKDLTINGARLEGKILNRGNVILIPEGVFYVMSATGFAVDRGTVDPLYIPPDAVATFSLGFSPDLAPGDYTVVLTFDLKEGDVLVREIDIRIDAANGVTILNVRK